AADLRRTLQWITSAAFKTPATPPSRRSRRIIPSVLAAAVVVLAIGAMAGRTYLGTSAISTASPVQLELSPPPNTSLTPAAVGSTPQIAISPDGHWIAFVAAERRKPSQIWLRPLDSRETKPLEGTVGAQFPFWSPDSRYLAFFAEGKLKKIAIAG